MFLHVSVSHSVHRGGSASVHAWMPPPKQTPPPEQTPPGSRQPLGADTFTGADTLRSRHPLRGDALEADSPPPTRKQTPQQQTPPTIEHAGRYDHCVGGTHPTAMQSCYFKLIPWQVRRSKHPPPPPRSRHPHRGRHPQGRHPLGADTPGSRQPPTPGSRPLSSRHPPPRSMLGDTINARAVPILLQCNLVILN